MMAEWQPIETAPRDGTRVLTLYDKTEVSISSWVNANRRGDPNWPGYWSPAYRSTHWQPLPESPDA